MPNYYIIRKPSVKAQAFIDRAFEYYHLIINVIVGRILTPLNEIVIRI